MANYKSREEEFRKLNEKLDDDFRKSTLNKIERRQSPADNISYETFRVNFKHRNNFDMVNDKFATYTKTKISTLNSMRKIGGGDCGQVSPKSPKSSPATTKTTTTTTNTVTNTTNTTTNTTNTKLSYGNTFNHQRLAKSLPKGGGVNVATIDQRKRPTRNADEEIQKFATFRRVPQPKNTRPQGANDTLIVRYKNEKFSSSSSLDNLIKESFEAPHETEPSIEVNIAAGGFSHTNSPQAFESSNRCGKNGQKLVNTGSLIRFLKSKVALLEDNQARNMREMTQQKEAYDDAMDRQKLMQQQRDKANLRNQALNEQLEKVNNQLALSNQRCREQSEEFSALKKEFDAVKRELKQLTLTHGNLEKRYARTREEIDAVQSSFASMRENERDSRESLRRETETKDAEIKCLKKQRTDLFSAYKKQLFLIDNLKQQNLCMEQSKMVNFCEKEFSKVLEWNLKP